MSKIVPVTYRIPVELKESIDLAAKDNNRSANSEAISRLNESLKNTDHATDSDIHGKLDLIITKLDT